MNRKAIFSSLLASILAVHCTAQVTGTEYYLPKTELHFQLLIEKSTFTPGEFAQYSERFLKKPADTEESVSYRLVGVSMYSSAVPDSAKHYVLPIDKKHTIFRVDRTSNGILLAINTKGKEIPEPAAFNPARKPKTLNPHDYMNEDILSAGSKAKMAELTVRDIYDIRTSRADLTRGTAEYMPQDGTQLRIMLANLDQQESILLQAFQGTTVCDTLQEEVTFCPAGNAGEQTADQGKQLLFRFSKKLGLVDADDLSGVPYYIKVDDLHIIPELDTAADGEKKPSDNAGITVNMPGKIRVSLLQGNNTVASFDAYAAQYGRLETLSSSLFGKKMTTRLQLNPVTGNVERIETEPLD